MQVRIMPAGVDDLPDLLALMQEYYAHDGLMFDQSSASAALRDLLNDQALGYIWLIGRNNLAIGYIVLTFGYSLEFGGRDAFIDEFYIQAGYRGRGIGARTLGLVELEARSMGIGALHLEVERGNHGAQRFYRSNGFDDRDRFYLMSKWL